jgi:L-ascorbate metabolism protein UlaG (beta-lactamase superfamily)
MSTACSITYIGGPTALIEIGGMRLLTDPTFDPPGQHSGDTVDFGGIDKIAGRFQVSVAVIHFGGVRFAVSGPARYTFNAAGGLRAAAAVRARTVVPIHFDGCSHFCTPRSEIDSTFAAAGKADTLRWPAPGQPLELEV